MREICGDEIKETVSAGKLPLLGSQTRKECAVSLRLIVGCLSSVPFSGSGGSTLSWTQKAKTETIESALGPIDLLKPETVAHSEVQMRISLKSCLEIARFLDSVGVLEVYRQIKSFGAVYTEELENTWREGFDR